MMIMMTYDNTFRLDALQLSALWLTTTSDQWLTITSDQCNNARVGGAVYSITKRQRAVHTVLERQQLQVLRQVDWEAVDCS